MSETVLLEPRVLAILAAIYLLGGFVKGAAAFGQPLFTIPLSAMLLPVPTAVAVSIAPVFFANVLQLFQNMSVWRAAMRYWTFYLSQVVGMLIGLQLLASVDQELLLLVIGVLILAFVASRLISRRGHYPAPPPRRVQVPVGFMSGLAAGTASFVGFPALLMFTAYDLDRRVFAFVTCVMFILSTAMLSGGLIVFGFYGHDTLIAGLSCIVPSAIGQFFGQKARDRMSDVLLRRIVLTLLVLIAVSLLARSL